MDQLDRQLWEQLSPLIDQVLELDLPRRATFLAALDVDRPDLAAALGRLLAAHDRAAAEDFLAVGPSMAPNTGWRMTPRGGSKHSRAFIANPNRCRAGCRSASRGWPPRSAASG